MRYLDKYPQCIGCPVSRYCGTVVSCFRLCNSYQEPSEQLDTPEDSYTPELDNIADLSDGDLYRFVN